MKTLSLSLTDGAHEWLLDMFKCHASQDLEGMELKGRELIEHSIQRAIKHANRDYGFSDQSDIIDYVDDVYHVEVYAAALGIEVDLSEAKQAVNELARRWEVEEPFEVAEVAGA